MREPVDDHDCLPYVYRVTKYDPADRDGWGRYTGAEDSDSDHGPVEAAYLQAVRAFAEDSGVDRLEIREPALAGFVHFELEPPAEGHGLAGLFPDSLAGYHDGAEVSLAVGVDLVRAMLRGAGAWCRLEVAGAFRVHVGWDQYVYVSSAAPCERALAHTRTLSLFPERLDASPYDAASDEEPGEQRPADDDFWDRLRYLAGYGPLLLEEGHVLNSSRWHRITQANIDTVRTGLAPRARLLVWPDLTADIDSVRSRLREEGSWELVWEDADGRISSAVVDDEELAAVDDALSTARAAAVHSIIMDECHPLFSAVLPDADGVLRARWRTNPCPGDQRWEQLKAFQVGEVLTGTVSEIASFGVVFVDLDGVQGQINMPELSSRQFSHPSEIVSVGEELTVRILDVDLVRERVALSLRSLPLSTSTR
ncbi:S1 RNA-binding domain-containing protein [Streptomyces polyrhachis]|uniref:S1 RNA-binding domain-containing protein n=1 Tax=Streptomyces polyrhachis TaxID=1282885 RepID=A0ABW2GDJ1_9ACTN